MNKRENDNQNRLEDLPVTDEQAGETKGGPESRDAHFRESTFGNELITP